VYSLLFLDRGHRTFRGWSGQFVLPGAPFAASLGSLAISGSKIMSRDYTLRFQQLSGSLEIFEGGISYSWWVYIADRTDLRFVGSRYFICSARGTDERIQVATSGGIGGMNTNGASGDSPSCDCEDRILLFGSDMFEVRLFPFQVP